MWSQLVTLVLGLLTVAVSANWLMGRETRALHRLKAEAELLALLPKDAGDAVLRRHLREQVNQYVREAQAFERLRRRWRVLLGLVQMIMLLGVFALGSGLLFVSGDVVSRTWAGRLVALGLVTIFLAALSAEALKASVKRRVVEHRPAGPPQAP
ncbi:hypothetical protein [Nocardioides sp. Arc9.136]|uniref:hypothetical protein n=1 Tax=Nocardioides sp. Arc9.136 TaxID=2996826 RepID=UPI002665AF22|nr:hypothetical protein [Nocardioides sp. Arc9.136]WKN47134.1 hypothetical protein OSR43_13910 [Nocardioides sp. Arc9.136]